MLKSGAWLVSAAAVPAARQRWPRRMLPDAGLPPAVDTITPVPLPEIPFGAPGADASR